MSDLMSEEDLKRFDERERKKAEVRARLEAASVNRHRKMGFMTPERKKKLRILLRKKAAEELRRQQEVKAAERRKVIAERTGAKQSVDDLNNRGQLIELCKAYHQRLIEIEGVKYDLEYHVGLVDYDIHELSAKLNEMRGKFAKPSLKKVPKFAVKIERMLLNARKEVGFPVSLRSTKKNPLTKLDSPKDKSSAPEWSWKKDCEEQEREV